MDEVLMKFLSELGDIRKRLREFHIYLERIDKLKRVQTNVGIYNKSNQGDPEVSMGIDADVITPVNNDRHSIGMSFSVSKNGNNWKFSGEVGWSSYDLGFDEEDSIEDQYEDIESLINSLKGMVESLIGKYISLIDTYDPV